MVLNTPLRSTLTFFTLYTYGVPMWMPIDLYPLCFYYPFDEIQFFISTFVYFLPFVYLQYLLIYDIYHGGCHLSCSYNHSIFVILFMRFSHWFLGCINYYQWHEELKLVKIFWRELQRAFNWRCKKRFQIRESTNRRIDWHNLIIIIDPCKFILRRT